RGDQRLPLRPGERAVPGRRCDCIECAHDPSQDLRGGWCPDSEVRISLRTWRQGKQMTERSYADLRDFIDRVEALGALRRIEGADPVCEIGGITEIAAGLPECPALLFDAIKGHARGFRVFTNATVSPQRAALALGIDPALRPIDALKEWMEKRKTLQPRAPLAVKDAAFLQNTVTGKDVDLAKLPAPIWHRHDGGAFLGSGSIVIMRDSDGGWINASIYRVQLHGRD